MEKLKNLVVSFLWALVTIVSIVAVGAGAVYLLISLLHYPLVLIGIFVGLFFVGVWQSIYQDIGNEH